MISLKPVSESHLDVIRPLLQSSVEESGLTEFSDVNDLMAKIRRGYENRCMGVYVDAVDNPQHLLILAHMPGLATKALAAFILRIYTLPEARGDTSAFDVMLATAENYAKLHGAESLMGSSWIFRGARDISALWEHYGFEPQERTFVKHLK